MEWVWQERLRGEEEGVETMQVDEQHFNVEKLHLNLSIINTVYQFFGQHKTCLPKLHNLTRSCSAGLGG